jgi:hypothetical protein
MAIERCDKCGKAFMSRTEVERHKVYEHPVPVSPFEERLAFDSSNNNGDLNVENLHRMTSDVMASNGNNNDMTKIGSNSRQIRKVPFRPFRM